MFLKTGTRGSANIDSVPRAQGKIESNMAYLDMFVQLATWNRSSSDRSIKESAVAEARRRGVPPAPASCPSSKNLDEDFQNCRTA